MVEPRRIFKTANAEVAKRQQLRGGVAEQRLVVGQLRIEKSVRVDRREPDAPFRNPLCLGRAVLRSIAVRDGRGKG